MARVREEIRVTADKLVETVRNLIHEGHVRRLVVRQGQRTLMEIPLTVAAVGVLVAPLLAAIGALAAVAADYTLEVEREQEPPQTSSRPTDRPASGSSQKGRRTGT
jgi:cytochrome c-type biogenesis protein CcmH/NrfF